LSYIHEFLAQKIPNDTDPFIVVSETDETQTMVNVPTVTLNDLPELWRELVTEAMNEILLTQEKGYLDMVIDLPPDQPPVIILAQTRQDSSPSAERAIGICRISENHPYSLARSEGIQLSFGAAAVGYMGYYDNGNGSKYRSEEQREALRQAGANAKVTIIHPPLHGKLINKSEVSFAYFPEADYFGQDKIVALVDLTSGEQITVVFFINMVHHGIQESQESIREFCGSKGEFWKISLSPDPTNAISPLDNLNISFSDFSGSALAQITGSGSSAQITLDLDAAGHGWYIDYTPYLNEEYLPTSNPYEWIAKPGSEAEGKMDFFSVLWHELGHAVGLDHTSDAHGLMSTTLHPGIRRLPSVEELALLSPINGSVSFSFPLVIYS
jgi:hypothetical protein